VSEHNNNWEIFHGDGREADGSLEKLPPPPPWRDLTKQYRHRGETYQATPHEVQMVNAALYLRRPLVISGPPGSGKSSLAYAVARELELGPVLKWPINSRSTLANGLYEYDAIARLRDLHEQAHRPQTPDANKETEEEYWKKIGDYVRLGPLGTALHSPHPKARPRALLIDEIDKSDVDFPNDLLNVLEEGEFEITELARIATNVLEVEVLAFKGDSDTHTEVTVGVESSENDSAPNTNDAKSSNKMGRRLIREGKVKCTVFPFIVITNNRERELPPALLRRCLRLDVDTPTEPELRRIIDAHFGKDGASAREEHVQELLRRFSEVKGKNRIIAVDQLLNALFLVTREHTPTERERKELLGVIMRALDEA